METPAEATTATGDDNCSLAVPPKTVHSPPTIYTQTTFKTTDHRRSTTRLQQGRRRKSEPYPEAKYTLSAFNGAFLSNPDERAHIPVAVSTYI